MTSGIFSETTKYGTIATESFPKRNESQTFSSQTSITRWKQMDDIPYLMVLFSVKWSQSGKGLFWSYRIHRGAENERKSRLGGESWGWGQATHPGPGAGSGLGIKASPHCGQHLACVACTYPELCLILFGMLGHYVWTPIWQGQAAVWWDSGPGRQAVGAGSSLYTRQGPGGLLAHFQIWLFC